MPASNPPNFLRWFGVRLPGNQSFWVPGLVWLQSWNLKELTEGHDQECNLRLYLTQHGKRHQVQTPGELTGWEVFLDSVGGGAWPFLAGGAICLVNSDNGRDSSLLNSRIRYPLYYRRLLIFLKGQEASSLTILSYKRSVIPLVVMGRTRDTEGINLFSLAERSG